jgi:formate dehydrogenase subunit delta
MVHMANQIALFFQTEPPDEAVAHVSGHLKQFWEPRMLRQLFAYISSGGAGLHNLVLEAAKTLH